MATRLYLHNAQITQVTLPTAEQSTLTANDNFETDQTINRWMDTTIGRGQVSLANTSLNVTSARIYYVGRWVSPLLNQTSISAQTWSYNFAAMQSNVSANFPVGAANSAVYVCCYVWRPSTNTKYANILDGNSAATVDEPAASTEVAHHVTFTGAAVSSLVAGDAVIVFEVWFQINQAASTAYTQTFYFEGTTANTTDNATVSNHASFIETPEDIQFLGYMDFNGTSEYIEIADAASLDLLQHSVAARFSTTTTSLTGERIIINKGGYGTDTAGENMNYGIWFAQTSGNLTGGFETGGSGADNYPNSGTCPNDGEIHTAVVTYDQVNVKLYLDGSLVDTLASTATPETNTMPLVIGKNARTGQLNRYWQGLIYEVYIWNNDLTTSEAQSFNTGTVPQTGALVYQNIFGYIPPYAGGPIDCTVTGKTITNKFITHI